MDPNLLGMGIGGAVVAAFGGMMVAGGQMRAASIFRRPRLDCGSAHDATGPARLEAVLRAPEPLVAPLSGKPCVYYELVINEVSYSDPVMGTNGSEPQTGTEIYRDKAWAPDCYLEDPAGSLPLLDKGVEVEGTRDFGSQVGILDAPDTVKLRRQFNLPSEGTFHLHESILEPGAKVFASGRLQRLGKGAQLVLTRDDELTGGSELGTRLRLGFSDLLGWLLVLGGLGAAAMAALQGLR